jgi:hypothetical protein
MERVRDYYTSSRTGRERGDRGEDIDITKDELLTYAQPFLLLRYSALTSTICIFFILMLMYKEPLFPTLCLYCQQRPPLWDASLCAVCQVKYDQQRQWQRVQDA